MNRLADDSGPDQDLWRDLIYGWGNPWTVRTRYLQAVWETSGVANAAILECGSGLTTLVLACMARKHGVPVWTLEHDPWWAARIERELQRFGLKANVILAPLIDYGDFDWYDVSGPELPRAFDVVVCDGPPGTNRGGRFGLVPVVGERLKSGCIILLDDASRPSEAATLTRWADDYALKYLVHEAGKEAYARCVVGPPRVGPEMMFG
jgi:predicted O-methyltransferase YrrM